MGDHAGHAGHSTSAPTTMMMMHDHGATTAATAADGGTDLSSAGAADSHAGHAGHASSGQMDMMRPYLFSDKTGFFVLFKKAFVNNTGGFVGALLATFFFGILTTVGYEFGKRMEVRARAAKVNGGARALPTVLLGALGHGFRLMLHYIAMLLVMTMNIWIIMAVLLGQMVGFLAFTFLAKGKPAGTKLREGERDGVGCDC